MSKQIIGREILRYDQVASTNDLAREFAARGEAEGLVITAQEQLAGRGRMGRQWIVPRGTSLQFSILLRPPLAPQHATRLMPMAALAIARTLEHEFNVLPTLKWPNDILLDGKKVCGILMESSIVGEKLAYVSLGIGLNVNYTMRDYPELAPFATTLQDVLGQEIDRSNLECALLAELDAYFARVCGGESLTDEYRTRLGTLGQFIRVASDDTILQGVAENVDDDGALILNQNGARVKLYAGDVTIIKGER